MSAQSILLTRPAAASARFAATLDAMFGPRIRVVISPLMVAVFRQPVLPARRFAALILTSETGAEAARRISAEGTVLPALAYCVGDRTAQAARKAGFTATSAEGDAAALLSLMAKTAPTGPLLYLHGRETQGDVAETLVAAGRETFSAIVYEQNAQPWTDEARRLVNGTRPLVLPLFSARSARLVARAGRGVAPLRIAALSPAVALAAADLRPDHLTVAAQPTADSLLKAITSLVGTGART